MHAVGAVEIWVHHFPQPLSALWHEPAHFGKRQPRLLGAAQLMCFGLAVIALLRIVSLIRLAYAVSRPADD